MSMSVGEMCDYIELLVGMAGVGRDDINRELIYRVINSKLDEFNSMSNSSEDDATIYTEDGSFEYELPPDSMNVYMVELDGEQIDRINLVKAVGLQER